MTVEKEVVPRFQDLLKQFRGKQAPQQTKINEQTHTQRNKHSINKNKPVKSLTRLLCKLFWKSIYLKEYQGQHIRGSRAAVVTLIFCWNYKRSKMQNKNHVFTIQFPTSDWFRRDQNAHCILGKCRQMPLLKLKTFQIQHSKAE